MPELPEVETIRKQLSGYFPMKIRNWEESSVSQSIVKERSFNPVGLSIMGIERRGKVLLFQFEGEKFAISGLGMSGGWRISKNRVIEKHTHIQMMGRLKNGHNIFLAYVDPRRFGNFHLLEKEETQKWLQRLGADVSSSDFTEEYIWAKIQKFPHKMIKPFLLEQNHFAGVGNYMASEICAYAKILPHRQCQSLTPKEAVQILKGTQKVLNQTITRGGTTFSGGYRDARGEKGEGVKNLMVFYQEICQMCQKTKIIKTILGQRGTYYCPNCQK